MGLKFRRGSTAQQSGSLAFGEPYVNTTLGTLVVGGASGDIVLSAGGTGSTGNFGAISGSGLDITGNANIAGNLTLGGAITIGDASVDTVNVVASLSSSLIPQTTNAFDLGSATKIWKDLYISTGSIKFVEGTSVVKTLSAATLTALEAATGSSNASITNINLTTASLNTSVSNLNSATSSYETNGRSIVSGSSQITYASISSIPAGIVSGSSQTIANLPVGTISGSSQVVGSSITTNTVTVGSTAIALGGTATTIAGLTSVTSTAFVGALTGNASTVTTNANLTGNVTSVGNATTIASGVVTSDMIVDGTIVNGDINASAAIVDTKLATIATAGKVSNSATTATNANTANAIVARDASGNFSAGTITATLTGNVTGNVTGNTSGTAATVTTAAQSAITSVGTLTSLTVSGATATGALTVTGAITATGDITAFYTSDKRHKNNIQTIPNALEKVSKLNGVTWEWNDDVNEVTKSTPKTGLIAQEVQEVLPEVVKTREDGFLALDYSKMMGLLVEAIKEQQIQIEELKAQIGSK